MMDLYFQFGISDATECEQCPQPGETTARMASVLMLDCSTSAFILFVKTWNKKLNYFNRSIWIFSAKS